MEMFHAADEGEHACEHPCEHPACDCGRSDECTPRGCVRAYADDMDEGKTRATRALSDLQAAGGVSKEMDMVGTEDDDVGLIAVAAGQEVQASSRAGEIRGDYAALLSQRRGSSYCV